MIVFLGDQVYADETTDEMQEFIASRRDINEPPGKQLNDYEEYAHLYSSPGATLPTGGCSRHSPAR